MMKEEVIVKSLRINRIGESQYFQITVPRDVKRIIGLEYGAIEKDGVLRPSPFRTFEAGEDNISLSIFPNTMIGRLVLRTAGCEGVFYQDDLIEDSNTHFGEVIAPVLWEPKRWTHGRKRHHIEFSIEENNVIYGFFQDSWGSNEYETFSYKLNLYLWIEKCIA